jgi:predicted HD phosphohydrolase
LRSLTARRPDPGEQVFIASALRGAAALLFAAQSPMDQAHALRAARSVAAAAPGRTDLVRAALLHDVGKTHAGKKG